MKRNFQVIAQKKGLDFVVELHDNLPMSILTDRQRTEQIIKNFLSNAFKFTSSGRVSFTICPAEDIHVLRRNMTSADGVAFLVSDTGIGIPKDKQQLVFEAFKQADGTTNRKYGGTGLGLSISVELAKYLGGEIKLESQEGKGSAFILVLPAARSVHPEKNQQALERKTALVQGAECLPPGNEVLHDAGSAFGKDIFQEDKSVQMIEDDSRSATALVTAVLSDHDKEAVLENKRILLVDDDMRNVYAITNILEEKGMKVVVGKNGKEGIDRLNRELTIDLVLMDIMMPVMDGYEAMKEIRKQKQFEKLPIIALTAKAMKGDRALCIEAGANDYLAKPFETENLLSMLRVWLC
jgi:two-component system chemotaxis sensor kinase CheA